MNWVSSQEEPRQKKKERVREGEVDRERVREGKREKKKKKRGE